MQCINPYRPRPGVEHGCGQCISCRINRRRVWAGRILLEATCHHASSFVTLTYADEHVPANNSLDDAHWREFTKAVGYRYFGVGEYGNKFGRPHYHLVLFGIDHLSAQSLALARWKLGFVHSAPFDGPHANYVASYTVKKLRSLDDSRLRPGQRPEFARMSRRPAIGTDGLLRFAHSLTSTPEGAAYIAANRDVPNSIRTSGGIFPLGTTMLRKLRILCDVPLDDPERVTIRRAYRIAHDAIPELKAFNEQLRVVAYERARYKASKLSGSL